MFRIPLLPTLLIATALAACSDELRSPISGPNPEISDSPEPGGRVTRIASAVSYELDAPPIGEVGNLCTYRTRNDPVMQGHSDRSGAAWQGEIRVRDVPSMDTKWFSASDKRVATVVARPRVETFRTRVDGNCYNAASRTYYSCNKVLEADLSKIRGFARALTMEQASRIAVQLCERKVAEVVESTLDLRQENIDLRCRPIAQAYCDLPPAPPPPAAKKK